MTKSVSDMLARQREISASLVNATDEEAVALEKEYNSNKREIEIANQAAVAKANAPKREMSKNEAFREVVKAVNRHEIAGQFQLKREATLGIVSSALVTSGESNYVAAAGLPVTIGDLINPLEMGLIYDKLGIKVATGVRGTLQWPVLGANVTATVAGETDALSLTQLSFDKTTATPVRVGISIAIDKEAENDAAFDLVGTVTEQINKSVGRLLNNHVLALAASDTGSDLDGPLVGASTVDFATAGAPTYAELLSMKATVLATGAEMSGFCYVMDAAMYSLLEATPKASGSGLFIIEDGKINGAPVFITDLAAYSGKVAAGCFGYVALNQHGPTNFVIDPFTGAARNCTYYTLNADWSVTTLQSSPFVIGA